MYFFDIVNYGHLPLVLPISMFPINILFDLCDSVSSEFSINSIKFAILIIMAYAAILDLDILVNRHFRHRMA